MNGNALPSLSPLPCMRLHIYAFLYVPKHTFDSVKKRSQILASEDLVLRAIRFGSYGDKIWFFRREDMAVFLLGYNCRDYQYYTCWRF